MRNIVLIFIILTPFSSFAFPSVSGGSGLVFLKSADNLLKNQWNASLFSDFRIYSVPSAHKVSFYEPVPDFNFYTHFNYGIRDGLETGVSIPFYINRGLAGEDQPSYSGLGNVEIHLSYSPFPGRRTDSSIAFTGYVSFPSASRKGELGGGEVNGGAGLSLSGYFGESKALSGHLNLGLDYVDYFEENRSNLNADIVSATRFFAGAGMEFVPLEWMGIMLELWGWRIFYSRDDSLNATVGFRLLPHKNIALTAAAAFRVTDAWKANNDFIGTIGISYISGERLYAYKAAVSPAPSPAKPSPPQEVRIRILNACEDENVVNVVIEHSTRLGFKVVGIGRYMKPLQTTSIYFNPDKMKEALDLSRAIPGRQQIKKVKEPMTNADVMVVAACDLLPKPAPPPAVTPPPPPPVKPSPPPPQPPPSPPPPVEVKKSIKEIRIGIFNACGTPGLARSAAKTLILRGLNVTQIGDAEVKGLQRTRVKYIPLYKDEAFIFGMAFSKNAELVEAPDLKDLEVLIEVGCDYRP